MGARVGAGLVTLLLLSAGFSGPLLSQQVHCDHPVTDVDTRSVVAASKP